MTRYSWTQPICGDCYAERNPGRDPVRVVMPEEEQCVHCGLVTAEGLYTRIDPDYARYPSLRKDHNE